MGSEYQPLSSAGSCFFIETSECFICRDVELKASDPLRNFCDCKNLLAHHACLSTWIQRGCGSEDRLRCIICKAKSAQGTRRLKQDGRAPHAGTFESLFTLKSQKHEYQLQRRSPWLSVTFQWQTWLVLITALVLLALVPYVVHCMMTAFTHPPPPTSFKVAAATFGLLTEILLIKCLSSYISTMYLQAERSSFTVRPRGSEDNRSSPGCWDRHTATSAETGHASAAASPLTDERKVNVFKSGCLNLF